MENIVSYRCPSCGAEILHECGEKENAYEICGRCRTRHAVADLENKSAPHGGGSGYASVTDAIAAVTYIDDAESALAYLENRFDNYDWNAFAETVALSLPDVDKMVDKVLLKAAANPATWELQFTSVITPLRKKLHGLTVLTRKFFDTYAQAEDLTDCFRYFDLYKKIVQNVAHGGGAIVKKLENAVKYHKKYKGDETVNTQLAAQLDVLKGELQALQPINDYKELPGFAAAKETKQKTVAEKLAAEGIDAAYVYERAVAAYRSGNRRAALSDFAVLRGYKDAGEYVREINAWLSFRIADGRFIKLGRKHYMLRKQAAAVFSLANLTKKKKKNAQDVVDDGVDRFALYEIVNKTEQKEPCVKNITEIYASYGGCLVYDKSGKICLFDSEANMTSANAAAFAERVIVDGKPGDAQPLYDKREGEVFTAGSKFFIRQKLTAVQAEEKKGCLALFGKNKGPQIKVVNKNNYRLLAVDLATGMVETIVPEMVDTHEIFGNEIFFNHVSRCNGEEKDQFYSYNFVTRKLRRVLSADTEILDVIGNKVIYFAWKPNNYNRDLYALDLESRQNILLDKNVCGYYGTVENMPYYYVGNATCKTLYRIQTNGTEKREIQSNADYFEDAVAAGNGWLYLIAGCGLNTSLAKMRTDGEQYIQLCPHFKRLVSLKEGHVFYVDVFDRLCMVRDDGSEYRQIIDNVERFVEVIDGAVYLLRSERVRDDERSHSLYKVNGEGKGLTKVAFDISGALLNPSNGKEIYLYKSDTVTYAVSVPVDKENFETQYETREVRSVLIYNVENDTFQEVAAFGTLQLENGAYTFKNGCFRKPITREATVRVVPNKISYHRQGVQKAGAVAEEQAEELVVCTPRVAGVSSYSSERESAPSGYTKATAKASAFKLLITAAILFVVSLFLKVFAFRMGEIGLLLVVAFITATVVSVIVCMYRLFTFKNRGWRANIPFMIAAGLFVIDLIIGMVSLLA